MARLIRPCLILIIALITLPVSAKELRIAVAANFKPILDQLAQGFEQEYGVRVLISSASSGILYNQILHGAPFDLFLSADNERPERLEQDSLTLPDSRQTYAYGRLVLWSSSDPSVSLADLKSNPGRLAIANPALAPYGKAAQQTLEQLQVWQGYQGRLVQGASIQQAWQFVASANAPYGLVAMAQVLDQPKASLTEIPEHYYQPIRQQMVILKRGNIRLANKFRDFLLSDNSQSFIAKRGYKPAQQPQ